jgi:hypothetical protein
MSTREEALRAAVAAVAFGVGACLVPGLGLNNQPKQAEAQTENSCGECATSCTCSCTTLAGVPDCVAWI